jgi:hypothetical protein
MRPMSIAPARIDAIDEPHHRREGIAAELRLGITFFASSWHARRI